MPRYAWPAVGGQSLTFCLLVLMLLFLMLTVRTELVSIGIELSLPFILFYDTFLFLLF